MMRFTTTGHAAWILAAGLCVSTFLYPSIEASAQEAAQAPEQPAAVGTATGVVAAPEQPTRLHPKKTASKSRKAERHAKAKKPAQEETATNDAAKADDLKPTQDDAMTPAVANANAQWADNAKPTDTYNMSAQAGNVLNKMDAQPAPSATATEDSTHAEQVVASDQLNELDRAAESQPPLTLAKATIDTPSESSAPSATVENTKPWEQTSMIGKVFIALGGLLTLASAARMFMA